ncbi:hypothetical protein [Paenibacillus lactis]
MKTTRFNEVKNRMQTYQFLMAIPITELVTYIDDDSDEYVEDPVFMDLRKALDIDIPVTTIYERYLDVPVHSGDVLMYASRSHGDHFVVLDTYRDPVDQLDLIRIGFGCTKEKVAVVRQLVRQLYDRSDTFIHYEEGQYFLQKLIDNTAYPKTIEYYGNVFRQRLKTYPQPV